MMAAAISGGGMYSAQTHRRESTLVDDPALVDHGDAVADLLDFCEQVAREQDGNPLIGEPADQRS